MTKLAILFDLDGTLTDSKPGITKSIAYALEQMGVRGVKADSLGWCVGPPLIVSLAKILEAEDDKPEKALHLFKDYYSAGAMFDNRVFEGVLPLLDTLKNEGKRLFVVTAKPYCHAIPILEHFDLKTYFEGIVAPERVGDSEEKASLIAKAIEQHRLDPNACIFVGDRDCDIIGANINNIKSIAVLYGYATKEELINAKPTYFAESPQQIATIIHKHKPTNKQNKEKQ